MASPQPQPARPQLGNQALQHLLLSGAIQAKLTVNQPGDRFEQEADQVAESVLRRPEPGRPLPEVTPVVASGPQRKCAECAAEEEEKVQRSPASSATPTAAPNQVESVLGSPGRPLEAGVRADLEPRFGRDFSRVRVHTDSVASESARQIHARAFTAGDHVVFGAGQFQPETESGRRLLAHELTHTLQQSAGNRQPHLQRSPDDESSSGGTTESGSTEADPWSQGAAETVSPQGGGSEPEEMKEGGGCRSSGRLDYPRGIRNRDTIHIHVGNGCHRIRVRLTARWACDGCEFGPDHYSITLGQASRSMDAGNFGIDGECTGTPAKTSTQTFQVQPGDHSLTILARATDGTCRLMINGYYEVLP